LNPGVASYDVHAEGKKVVIALEGSAQAAGALSAAPAESRPAKVAQAAAPEAAPEPVNGVVRAPEPVNGVVRAPEPVNGVVRAPEPVNGVVRSKVDEKPVKHPAQKITAVTFKADRLR